MIPDGLLEFFASGVSIQVGTRDASLFPEDVRAVGCRAAGAESLTVFVPHATGQRTIENLRDNARIAVCFARPLDHKTIQVKGRVTGIDTASAADRELVDRYRADLARELGAVGLLPRIVMRLAHWPCHAVTLAVETVFEQTPGPGAGDRLPLPEVEAR